MKLKNSIIIHGPGRSGTTLLDNVLSLHEDFFWISGYLNKYPKKTSLSLLHRMHKVSSLERMSRKRKYIPRPNEAYQFWRHYFHNFNQGNQVEVDEQEIKACLKALRDIQKFTGGKRFITKFTGSSRFAFIDGLFEKPTIVWIDRNPQSVVMSYYKQRWHYKSDPALFESKSTPELIREYVSHYESVLKGKEQLRQFDFVQVYYEDLVKDPQKFFRSLCERLGLDYSPRFEKIVDSWEIRQGTNMSYRSQLNEEEIRLLDELCDPLRVRVGY